MATDGDVGFADVPSDSRKYFQDLFSSMEADTFITNFSDMVGSWDPLDCIGEDSKSTNFNDSPLSAVQPAKDKLEPTASQMLAMIDTTVAEISLSPKWQNVPGETLANVVKNLKAVYENSDRTLYPRSQAVALMELTGRTCGDLVSRCNG